MGQDLSIKAARVEKGYTQEAIAQKLGVSKRAYIQWENGERVPKPMFMFALAYIFGMEVDYLRVPERKKKVKNF